MQKKYAKDHATATNSPGSIPSVRDASRTNADFDLFSVD
jgi:hypothetical protein